VPRERTAVLVIRAWATTEGHRRLRARIMRVPDLAAQKPVESVAGSEEDVVDVVRSWLRTLAGSAER
jgi:hypothetical protein